MKTASSAGRDEALYHGGVRGPFRRADCARQPTEEPHHCEETWVVLALLHPTVIEGSEENKGFPRHGVDSNTLFEALRNALERGVPVRLYSCEACIGRTTR